MRKYCKMCGSKLKVISKCESCGATANLKKGLFLTFLGLLALTFILTLISNFKMTESKLGIVTRTDTDYYMKLMSVMFAEIFKIDFEYILYIVNIILFITSIMLIIMPVIKKEPLKPRNFLMCKIYLYIMIIELALGLIIVINYRYNSSVYTMKTTLDLFGYALYPIVIATLVMSYIVTHKLKSIATKRPVTNKTLINDNFSNNQI